MNKDAIIGAAAAFAVLVAAGFLLAPDAPKDGDPVVPSKNPPDQTIPKAGDAVKSQTPKDASKATLAEQVDVSALLDSDGTTLIPVKYEPDGGITKYDAFPCAWRAAGAPVEDCQRIEIRDGKQVLVDFGDENTMTPGDFSGPGCVPRPCVLPAGFKTP